MKPANPGSHLGLGHRLLPCDCALCGAESGERPLCAGCLAALPRLPAHLCPVCAEPSGEGRVCGACLSNPPAFDRSTPALTYRFPADALIQAFKYGGDLPVGRLLARLLRNALVEVDRPDAIVPMPLHPERLKERGFNQALELARDLSRALGVPVLTDACLRVRNTPPQAALPWDERGDNIRGAFACQSSLEGLRLALLDDVMTSGHTLNEVAKTLKRAGALSVHCWVVARTVKDGDW